MTTETKNALTAYHKEVIYDLYQLLKKYDAAIDFFTEENIWYAHVWVGKKGSYGLNLGPEQVFNPVTLDRLLFAPRLKRYTKLKPFLKELWEFVTEHDMVLAPLCSIYIGGKEVVHTMQLSPYYVFFEWQHMNAS